MTTPPMTADDRAALDREIVEHVRAIQALQADLSAGFTRLEATLARMEQDLRSCAVLLRGDDGK